MKDSECVQFLQWALPHMHMRWPGFRKVRNQVCKRLQQRIKLLQLEDLPNYRGYLDAHIEEWAELDKSCQITISRFYRDKMVFTFVEEQVFPRLLHTIEQQQESELRIWCAGSAAGEEAYTLSLIWALQMQSHYPDIKLSIVGTEINPAMIIRAHRACYPESAIKNLSPAWREVAFNNQNDQFCLRPEYQSNIEFRCQDLRLEAPVTRDKKLFHLICCRNLAFTYFDTSQQQEIVRRIHANLENDGVLIVGVHEEIPPECTTFTICSKGMGIYLRTSPD